jgi:predicted DNA binding CopG/RHH family protein
MSSSAYKPASAKTLEREARAWDSQAVTPRGWEKAPEAVPRARASTAISLRIPTPMLEAMKALAQREDVGYQVLIKRWLDDRLRKERDKLARRRPRRATSPRP